MRDKILEEALKWYEHQDGNPDIEDFIDIVIHKTTDSLFDKVIEELRGEFSNGNLKHNFAISSDYYLDLKFKDIKDKCIKNMKNDFSQLE